MRARLRAVGYRGNENWRDMSDFVVHFTTGYDPWISILYGHEIRPGVKPLGAARWIPELAEAHRSACFSEIPLDMLDRLIERRSLYGVGFQKDVLISYGGAPLWYLDKESLQGQMIYDLVKEKERAGVDPDDFLWTMTPFIDSPGNYQGTPYRFEWEREWRINGPMDFDPKEVSIVFLPEDEHERARQFFADVEIENVGPAYFGPYVDPRWGMDQIQAALEHVPPKPEPSASAVPWWLDARDFL